jgi:hypothetical protein
MTGHFNPTKSGISRPREITPCDGAARLLQAAAILSSTFRIFHPPGRQVITQKISS